MARRQEKTLELPLIFWCLGDHVARKYNNPLDCNERNSRKAILVTTRLQLGASRLEYLEPRVLQAFLDKTWIHLGEAPPAAEHLREGSQQVFPIPHTPEGLESEEPYRRTNFQEFYYQKGDALRFDDSSIDYIFSEHFFEHLFLDEALSLLKECCRILKPYGVIRTCVPDADLRTYEPPEPVGFPDVQLPFTAPAKHKTRWSVYSLAEALRLAGFEPIPLRYCTRSGQYICIEPSDIKDAYGCCPDPRMVFDLSYIMRIDSLIVDGVKKPTQ